MVKYEASIQSAFQIEEIFAYLSNFCSAVQWDPGVLEANQVKGSKAALGSTYDIVAKFGISKVPLRYEVTKFSPPTEIEFVAIAPNFVAKDVMKFRETAYIISPIVEFPFLSIVLSNESYRCKTWVNDFSFPLSSFL